MRKCMFFRFGKCEIFCWTHGFRVISEILKKKSKIFVVFRSSKTWHQPETLANSYNFYLGCLTSIKLCGEEPTPVSGMAHGEEEERQLKLFPACAYLLASRSLIFLGDV